MKKLIAMIVILVLTLIPESCLRRPLSANDVESFMSKNWDDIVLINDYLLEVGGRDALVWDSDGTILIDLADQRIEEVEIKKAIQVLWSDGCFRISKQDDDNAIIYSIWKRYIGDIDCGFVYAIDHTRSPKVQYLTKLIPLSEEGWYYYLAEYEKWRVLNRDKD